MAHDPTTEFVTCLTTDAGVAKLAEAAERQKHDYPVRIDRVGAEFHVIVTHKLP